MKTNYFKAGTSVKGNYCGVDFTGHVMEENTHYNESTKQMDYWIKLDSPITVFGSKRETVITSQYELSLI